MEHAAGLSAPRTGYGQCLSSADHLQVRTGHRSIGEAVVRVGLAGSTGSSGDVGTMTGTLEDALSGDVSDLIAVGASGRREPCPGSRRRRRHRAGDVDSVVGGEAAARRRCGRSVRGRDRPQPGDLAVATRRHRQAQRASTVRSGIRRSIRRRTCCSARRSRPCGPRCSVCSSDEREVLVAHEVSGQDTEIVGRWSRFHRRSGGCPTEPGPGQVAGRVPAGVER